MRFRSLILQCDEGGLMVFSRFRFDFFFPPGYCLPRPAENSIGSNAIARKARTKERRFGIFHCGAKKRHFRYNAGQETGKERNRHGGSASACQVKTTASVVLNGHPPLFIFFSARSRQDTVTESVQRDFILFCFWSPPIS